MNQLSEHGLISSVNKAAVPVVNKVLLR